MKIENRDYRMRDFFTIPLVVSPGMVSLRVIDKIIYALIPSLQVLTTAKFIDTAINIFNGQAEKSWIIIPLVGENGSGKPTLVRLMIGLYLPDEGDVLYGEANTRAISASSLFQKISVVFQKYQRYQMTLRENIGIGDVHETTEDDKLDKVCAQAGIDRSNGSLTKDYETMLSREFDGVDLSAVNGSVWLSPEVFFVLTNSLCLTSPQRPLIPLRKRKYTIASLKFRKIRPPLLSPIGWARSNWLTEF